MSTNNDTIGIDLRDRRHAVCVLSAAGDIVAETDVTNSREGEKTGAGCLFSPTQGAPSPVLSRKIKDKARAPFRPPSDDGGADGVHALPVVIWP